MRRREFIRLIGGAAVWPLPAHAQRRLPTIGFLGPASASAMSAWAAAFVQRLHELGWIEGRTVAIEYRWADGRLRLRGPRGAQDEFTLAAIAQNLRRLAKLAARAPPTPAACVA